MYWLKIFSLIIALTTIAKAEVPWLEKSLDDSISGDLNNLGSPQGNRAVALLDSYEKKFQNAPIDQKQNLWNKMKALLFRGAGVGGISQRPATPEERETLFKIFQTIQSFKGETFLKEDLPLVQNSHPQFLEQHPGHWVGLTELALRQQGHQNQASKKAKEIINSYRALNADHPTNLYPKVDFKIGDKFQSFMRINFESLPGDQQPILSRTLPKDVAKRILNINYLWNLLKTYQSNIKPNESMLQELQNFTTSLKSSPLVEFDTFLGVRSIGAAHVNNLLLQYDYFFSGLTADIILGIVLKQGSSTDSIFSVDGIRFSPDSILTYGIPSLGYSLTQIYNQKLRDIPSGVSNPGFKEKKEQAEQNLQYLEQALLQAIQKIKSSFHPISLTEEDIPSPVPSTDYKLLQEYALKLWDQIEKTIKKAPLENTNFYRGDINDIHMITSYNLVYLNAQGWLDGIGDIFGFDWAPQRSAIVKKREAYSVEITNELLLNFLDHCRDFPESFDHFLDPYNMVWLTKSKAY